MSHEPGEISRAPAGPSGAAGVDALVAHEDRLAVLSRLAQSVPRRWGVVLLALAVAVADVAFDVFPTRWPALFVPPAVELSLNVWCASRWRAGRATPRDFWAMLVIDAFGVTGMCALLGSHSVLALPALVVINAGYGLGLPRAAHVHLALAVVLYPAARVIGAALAGTHPSPAGIAIETLVLVGLARIAVASPIQFTRRLRHTRRGLGALARGDFTQRLPASERDDLGFLAGSFNLTAAALGELVEALRASEARLVVAERDARATADRMHVVAGAAAGVLGAGSLDALRAVLARACAAVLPVDELSFRVHDAGAAPAEAEDGGASGSVLRAPIVAGGAVLGCLTVRSRAADAYGGDDALVLEAIAALAATAIRNIRLVDELRRSQEALAHQAFHDPITGLANRAGFNGRVHRALDGADATRATVLMIDLDGFKSVNDRLGHAAGDRLLAAVAERLADATRGADTVARIGGDEFAVLLHEGDGASGADDDGAAEALAGRVLDALRAPFVIEGTEVWVGASVGIARNTAPRAPRLVDARAGDPPELRDAGDALLRRADAAMYTAKARGKGRLVVFEPSMLRAAGARQPRPRPAPPEPVGAPA